MGIRWEAVAKAKFAMIDQVHRWWEGGVGVKEETAKASSTVGFTGPPAVSLADGKRRQLRSCKNGEEVGRREGKGTRAGTP